MSEIPKLILVKKILVNPNNPRFYEDTPSSTEIDAINAMIALGNSKILSLCEDIAIEGLMPNQSLIISPIEEKSNCYLAHDGNRRLTCIKLMTVYKNHLNKFNLSPSEVEKIKKLSDEKVDDVNFSKDIINIISVAKIVPSKGYDRLMKIHKKLIEKNIKNHIYILGIGEEKEKYEKYLAENNLTDTFTFLGYRDNPYKYVKKADLYVCSSRREGFSTAVTEALIVGTPVVSTNCSGAYELLGKNNEYGIVTENDEDALYEGIKKMLTMPDLLEAYAAKAKERGKAFSTEKTVKAVEEMLLSI